MAKLYYGNSSCTIEGSNIMGVEIRYKGKIEIEDKTSNSFAISHHKNGIMIFPIANGTLNNLFEYKGEFKILSVIVADINAEKVHTTIHRVMDYAKLLNTKAEDMTTISENLSSSHVSGNKVAKTILKQQYIENQHTSMHDGSLYLKDGSLYNGKFRVNLKDNSATTETDDLLYFEDGRPTKNPNLISYASIIQARKRKLQSIIQRTRKIR
tara:strand:- start:524 stop:1156 length:633 start_codon:yes stop_codon:yes gene_type:complete